MLDEAIAPLPEMFQTIAERPADEPPYQAVCEGVVDFALRHRDLLNLLIPQSPAGPVLTFAGQQRTLIDFEDTLAVTAPSPRGRRPWDPGYRHDPRLLRRARGRPGAPCGLTATTVLPAAHRGAGIMTRWPIAAAPVWRFCKSAMTAAGVRGERTAWRKP